MDVKKAIEQRRAYRSLESCEISDEMVRDLINSASLAPSCFNKQPWRFVCVQSSKKLTEVFESLPTGNHWATKASMVVAVYSQKKLDCVIGEREYYLFDTGMAVAFMILRATELGLVAHPIAGYDNEKAKQILGIEKDLNLIALLIIGRHADSINEELSDKQKKDEVERPKRKSLEEISQIR